ALDGHEAGELVAELPQILVVPGVEEVVAVEQVQGWLGHQPFAPAGGTSRFRQTPSTGPLRGRAAIAAGSAISRSPPLGEPLGSPRPLPPVRFADGRLSPPAWPSAPLPFRLVEQHRRRPAHVQRLA